MLQFCYSRFESLTERFHSPVKIHVSPSVIFFIYDVRQFKLVKIVKVFVASVYHLAKKFYIFIRKLNILRYAYKHVFDFKNSFNTLARYFYLNGIC